MHYPTLILTMLWVTVAAPAAAAEVAALAGCSSAVFTQISRTSTWSGKAPKACKAQVAVHRTDAGIAVTAWSGEAAASGDRTRTSFTGVLDYEELANKGGLSAALSDLMVRARHLERCLVSLRKHKDPLDCRLGGARDYLAGEETGVKDSYTLTIPDDGRSVVVEYQIGSTIATPDQPADLEAAQPLPPGVLIDLRRRGGGGVIVQ
jgi:hypothetical protein